MLGLGNTLFRVTRAATFAAAAFALAISPGLAENKKTTQQYRPVQQSRPVRNVQPYRPVIQNYTRPGLAGGFVRPVTRSNGFVGPARTVGPRIGGGTNRFTYRGRTFRRIAGAPYRWPFGYHYTRYAVGGYLPHAFWISDYYVSDYATYGLDAPPPNFEWVRYGPDLLLVDLNSGAIAQTVYGAYDDPDADAAATDAGSSQ